MPKPETATTADPTKCPHCGGDHEVCPGCGRHPDQIAATEPANTPKGTRQMPEFTALYCRNCGYWMIEKGKEPERFLIRDVPTLDPWIAYFMGILMTRVEHNLRNPVDDLLAVLAAGPPRKKKAEDGKGPETPNGSKQS